MPTTKKTASAAKKAPAKAASKAPAKAPAKAAAKKAPAAAAKKTPAKKAPAPAAKSAPAKKSAPAATKATKAAPAKKSGAAPSRTAKESAVPSKKSTSTSAPAAKKAPAKKAAAEKAPAKAAEKAPAKKAAPVSSVPPVTSVLGSLPRLGKNPPARLTKSPYDAKFLEAQRALLLKEREGYERQAEALFAEAQALTANREPGDVQFDEESGEGDTLAVERDQDLELSARARATVEDIDLALERIDNGVYGICAGSGQAIPKERLKAIPWATERVEYKVGGFGRL